MKKIECTKCHTHIRACNFRRHVEACSGDYQPFKKATNCKYCGLILEGIETANRANHIRWCNLNPRRSEYKATNDGSQLRTPEAILRRTEGIKKAHADGKYDHIDRSRLRVGWKHTEETKELIRKKALASKHRRLVKSVQVYTRKDGTTLKLDSSWEVALAKRLDELNIEWTRPKPIPWVDKKGQTHYYFPDFYLPHYDLLLDPKNEYARNSQKEKLVVLTSMLNNLIIIETLEECQTFNPKEKESASH